MNVKIRRSFCRFVVAVFAIALAAGARAQEAESSRYEFSAQKMGVPTRILFYAPDAETANRAADAVWKKFDELNAVLSDWDPESEIIRACRQADETGERVEISAELRRALSESRRYCELTGGVFDATVSPVVKLWRRSRYFHERPPESALNEARKRVGLNVWSLDDSGLKTEQGVRFDVGGIAKGIVLDEALDVLKEFGINSALVDASGDLRIGDPPPGKSGWTVGVASLGDRPAFYCELANVGIASSGDANRYVEIDGVRYSHIVDPRTCEPLTRRCAATVLAPTATTADALASALCVLGGDAGGELIENIARDGVGEGGPLRMDWILFQGREDGTGVDFAASERFCELYKPAERGDENASAPSP